MSRSVVARLNEMADTLDLIAGLLSDATPEELKSDRVRSAAYERFLEIVSEASRHVPDTLKEGHQEVPWRRIADLGNWLRHVYDRVDADILWNICRNELAPLRTAVAATMITARDKQDT